MQAACRTALCAHPQPLVLNGTIHSFHFLLFSIILQHCPSCLGSLAKQMREHLWSWPILERFHSELRCLHEKLRPLLKCSILLEMLFRLYLLCSHSNLHRFVNEMPSFTSFIYKYYILYSNFIKGWTILRYLHAILRFLSRTLRNV